MTYEPNAPQPANPGPRPRYTPTHYETPPPATEAPAPGLDRNGRVRKSRSSALWVGAIVTAILLIALLIFIAQNSQRVTIHYLGLNGHFSLAIALLLAAVIGVLLIAIPGSVRILQLRRALKKNAR